MHQEPINVICMKWGTKYNGPYVNTLRAMVARHLKRRHRFACFTDNSEGFHPEVEVFPLPTGDLNGDREFGWNKLAIYGETLGDLTGPTLFLDLDLIITGELDSFFDYLPGEFCIIRDWQRPWRVTGNSSVFRFEIGKHTDVLSDFLADPDAARASVRNEQEYLSYKLHEKGRLQYWPAEWCCSFKRHCMKRFPMYYLQSAELPETAKVVVFHGNPKPDEAMRGKWTKLRYIHPTPWIAEHWAA
jgi:hypothetical protein